MNRSLVQRLADAVLYEGYILYPYRPSVKNRQRWTFGGLYPEEFCQEQRGADASSTQTECLIHGGTDAVLTVAVRFLSLTARHVGAFDPPLVKWSEEAPFRPVDTLKVGDRLFQSWQEAEERSISLGELPVGSLLAGRRHSFSFPARRWQEPLRGLDGSVHGVLVREQEAIQGTATVAATQVGEELYRLTLRVANGTALDGQRQDRDAVLLRTLVSTHVILGVRGGRFLSLLEPPEEWRDAAAACQNVGLWPVLVGEAGQTDTMLASPIILYDYPQLAPESPGDFFDGTEIDEMLTLRILTLTEDEKASMAALDERTRALLQRTEALASGEGRHLHGAIRDLRPVEGAS